MRHRGASVDETDQGLIDQPADRQYPRFQYEGYWISLMDPWPEYWGNDWYDNGDVYVAYTDNGYYLYNRRYPNVGIAISIST